MLRDQLSSSIFKSWPIPAAAERQSSSCSAGKLIGLALCTGMAASFPSLAAAAPKIPVELYEAASESLCGIEAAGAGRYSAQNLENHLALAFDGQGLDVAPSCRDPGWHWRLKLSSYGTSGHLRPVEKAVVVVANRRVEYRRGTLTEWYENRPEGLEQGFTLARPPQAGASRIELRLSSGGDLRVEISPDGKSACLRDRSGQAVLDYRA